jgi:hypothetical protein
LSVIYKEKQKGAVAKSYMTNGLLIYYFATAPIRISLYMRKIFFSFLSVQRLNLKVKRPRRILGSIVIFMDVLFKNDLVQNFRAQSLPEDYFTGLGYLEISWDCPCKS